MRNDRYVEPFRRILEENSGFPFVPLKSLVRYFLALEKVVELSGLKIPAECLPDWPMVRESLSSWVRFPNRVEFRKILHKCSTNRMRLIKEVADILLNAPIFPGEPGFPGRAFHWLNRKSLNLNRIFDPQIEQVLKYFTGFSSTDLFAYLETVYEALSASVEGNPTNQDLASYCDNWKPRHTIVEGVLRSIRRGDSSYAVRTKVLIERSMFIQKHQNIEKLAKRALIAINEREGIDVLFEQLLVFLPERVSEAQELAAEFSLNY